MTTPENSRPTVVWTEIPVSDIKAGTKFYTEVFGFEMTIDNTGPNPMANFTSDMSGVAGHLYPGTPAESGNGPTIHLTVPDSLETAGARCRDAGGTIIGEPIEIPPGRFVYAIDPDGNSIGLFEAKG